MENKKQTPDKNIPAKNGMYHQMNGFQKFLMMCSGSNLHILQKSPSEWNKYAGIGGIVLFTAVFATLSASYAMFTVFEDVWVSAGFGILWGLMIFNLDRYIVSSIKKTGSFWNQFFMAVPRLILATFLGIVISKPLELKIFEKEVNKQLNTIIQRNKTESVSYTHLHKDSLESGRSRAAAKHRLRHRSRRPRQPSASPGHGLSLIHI